MPIGFESPVVAMGVSSPEETPTLTTRLLRLSAMKRFEPSALTTTPKGQLRPDVIVLVAPDDKSTFDTDCPLVTYSQMPSGLVASPRGPEC